MVRHKTRWLLVRLEFEEDVLLGTNITPRAATSGSRKRRRDDDSPGLTKKDLARCLRESMASSFGIAASGIAQDVQVRWYDESSRLVMIRVPRDSYGLVWSAITLLTTIQGRSIVASVVSVNGSARTAKRVAILETRRQVRIEGATGKRELKDLEERLAMIRRID